MKYGPVKKFLDEAEKRTGKDRMTLIGLGCVPLVLLFGSTVVHLICCLFASLYPAYSCLQAILSKNQVEQQRWMEFWVVMSLLYVTDLSFPSFLSAYIPLFWMVKFSMLAWCIIPGSNNGSKIIFGKVISPLYVKFGKQIEDYVCEVREAFVTDVTEATTAVAEIMEVVGENVAEVMEEVGEVIEEVGENVAEVAAAAVAEVMEEVGENVLEDAIDSTKLLEDVADLRSKITSHMEASLPMSAGSS